MNFAINKSEGRATFIMDLADPNDRSVAISWLKSLTPSSERDQFEIDKCVLALGGTPEQKFPSYEVFQQ